MKTINLTDEAFLNLCKEFMKYQQDDEYLKKFRMFCRECPIIGKASDILKDLLAKKAKKI